MNNSPTNKDTNNKGVNIDLPEIQSQKSTEFCSLNKIKTQIIEVIDSFDVMESTVPHCPAGSSNEDADNEDSIISTTSVFSSVFQVKQKHTNKKEAKDPTTPCESPREISEISKVSICPDCQRSVPTHEVVQERPSQHPQPICLPAVLPPAVLCMNPSCVCAHSMGYMQTIPFTNLSQAPPQQNVIPENKYGAKHRLSDFIQKLTVKKPSKETGKEYDYKELYKINFMQEKDNGKLPKRFVFDLVQNDPKPDVSTRATNTKKCSEKTCSAKNLYVNERLIHSQQSQRSYRGIYSNNSGITVHHSNETFNRQTLQQPEYYKNLEEKNKLPQQYERDPAKIDVYYFDHGNAAYFRTTDSPPIITTELLAEKTESYATKFWAELFGTVYIVFAFITTFILQFFRFLLYSLVRPLTIGLLQLLSDYFFKPLLAAIFNAVVQPPLIFCFNIATSIRDLCEPIADGIGYFIREISVICKSIRLFEIKQDRTRKKINAPPEVNNTCECPPD